MIKHRHIIDHRKGQDGNDYVMYYIKDKWIVVHYANSNSGIPSFPLWEIWESKAKKRTLTMYRGSSLDDIGSDGYFYSSSYLAACAYTGTSPDAEMLDHEGKEE